jgi:hypothetical protein
MRTVSPVIASYTTGDTVPVNPGIGIGIPPIAIMKLIDFRGLTNPHWAGVVGFNLFCLCVIHKEGLCPAVGTLIG